MNTNLTTLEEGSGNEPVSPKTSTTTATTTMTMTTISSTTTTQIKTTTMPTDDEDLVIGT